MAESDARAAGPGAECAEAASAEAYVLGELGADERARFECHLAGCERCRRAVDEAREIVSRLRELPVEEGRDLVTAVLERLPAGAWSPPPGGPWRAARFRRASIAAATAALLAVCAAWLVARPPQGRPPAAPSARTRAVERALDWLVSSQEPDGSWSAERWGGNSNYTVGLTSLALLALLSEDEIEPERARAAERATAYLLSAQNPGGRIGPAFSGTLYNHGIASCALLERFAATRSPGLKAPVGRALEYIRGTQTASGGWGYAGGRQVNTAISAWQISALLLAASLGWPEERASAERALAWLRGMLDSRGRAGYDGPGRFKHGPEGPTAMAAFLLSAWPAHGESGRSSAGAEDRRRGSPAERAAEGLARVIPKASGGPDYYRSYFFAYARRAVEGAFGAEGPREGLGIDELAASARGALVESQVIEGPHSGSFEPCDRWSLTGGRVYATAMAALSLQAEERAPRMLQLLRGDG